MPKTPLSIPELLHSSAAVGRFIPLLTDLPALDALLRRHRVPRRGLVHFDVTSTLASGSLVDEVCYRALERGENVVRIAVEPDKDWSRPQERDEEATFRLYFAGTLSQLNDRLYDLVHEDQPPDLITVENFERLFDPDAPPLAEPPFPMDGFALLGELVDPEQRDSVRGQGSPNQTPCAGVNSIRNTAAELRARLWRVALCQWLAAQGTIFRTLSSSLWLVPSAGTPSLADLPSVATGGGASKNRDGATQATGEAREAHSLSLRFLLDIYCDYSLRWGALTHRLDGEAGRTTRGYPLWLHSFSLPLGEALVATIKQPNEEGPTGAKEHSGVRDAVEELPDRGFGA